MLIFFFPDRIVIVSIYTIVESSCVHVWFHDEIDKTTVNSLVIVIVNKLSVM